MPLQMDFFGVFLRCYFKFLLLFAYKSFLPMLFCFSIAHKAYANVTI